MIVVWLLMPPLFADCLSGVNYRLGLCRLFSTNGGYPPPPSASVSHDGVPPPTPHAPSRNHSPLVCGLPPARGELLVPGEVLPGWLVALRNVQGDSGGGYRRVSWKQDRGPIHSDRLRSRSQLSVEGHDRQAGRHTGRSRRALGLSVDVCPASADGLAREL